MTTAGENHKLRQMLGLLDRRVRENERIWTGFRDIETRLIGARTLGELVGVIGEGIPATFPAVNCATVACIDPEYEMLRLLRRERGDGGGKLGFVAASADELETLFAGGVVPRLGAWDPRIQIALFPACPGAVGSMALVPLLLRGRLLGSLNQASVARDHFAGNQDTSLLEHLASVAALCIDNVLSHERLRQDGLTDPLTGVANRRFFERRLAEEIQRCARQTGTLSCLMADIDRFKQINDRLGHHVGDLVLRQVAQSLAGGLRANDVLARYGGEEFVFLLPDTSVARAADIAERMRRHIGGLCFDAPGARSFGVTVSLGVAGLTLGSGQSPRDDAGQWLLRQADTALYRAKDEGRDQVRVASGETLSASSENTG